MNERIQELAEQTGILFYNGRIPETGYEYQGAEVTKEDLQNFAELIVEECGRVADVFCHIWCEEDKPHDVTVSNYIKRHVLRADPE
jgi:hypothetical protein